MSDNDKEQPVSPDEFTEEMADRLAEMEADDTLDFDARTRQEDGWLNVYIECPDCKVPMAEMTIESETIPAQEPDHHRSKSRHIAICPSCKSMETAVTVYRDTHPFGEKVRSTEDER